MRIALASVGTTGDVRPFAALAGTLRGRGHEVTALSWELHRPAFEPAVSRFLAAGPETSWEAIRQTAALAAEAPSPMAQVAALQGFHLREAADHYRALREALDGHDLVLLHGIHSLAEAAARDVGARWTTAVFDPVLLPTRSAPPAGMPSLGPFNGLAWRMLDRALRRADRPLREALTEAGSPSAAEVTMFRARSPRLHLVACSPAIAAPPRDLPSSVHYTGAWIPQRGPDPLDPALEAFVAAGDAPIVITFGSMAGGDPAVISAAVSDALAGLSVRAVVQRGAASLSPSGDEARVYHAGETDHRALFPRAALVVHHGGAGTTHAAAAAGIPSVVVPHVGDQPYWARQLYRLGVAPEPLPVRALTGEALAGRIRLALADEAMHERAAALAERMRTESGTARAAELLEDAAVR